MVILLCALVPSISKAIDIIDTVAGGGTPNNVPALQVGLGAPRGVAVDGAGNTYIAALVLNMVFKVDPTGVLTTVAGTGLPSFCGDGGQATSACLSFPFDVAVDAAGNLFIADGGNARIRKVAASTGIITTFAGTGSCCFGGDGGLATNAVMNNPSGVAVDAAGNLFIADPSNRRIRKVAASTGIITTVAGNGSSGFSGDGGLATNARLNSPTGVVVDAAGNLFIADRINRRIRKVAASTGIITTVAGNGSFSFSGDGGLATNAGLGFPTGVAVDAAGNLFIATANRQRIRRVAASTGIITTVAGNGTFGFCGDGGAATSACLANPNGVAVDAAGNLFIADSSNNRIRKVAASTGIITTVAGNGTFSFCGDGGAATSACLDPADVAVDAASNLFIADRSNNRIWKVAASTGIITTVAGNGSFSFSGDGGLATNAGLRAPTDVAVDAAGNLLIADNGNRRIRKVAASTGVLTTVAGTGSVSFCGDGGAATSACLDPAGVAVDAAGNLFIADTFNNRVRKVDAGTGIISTVAGNGSSSFCGDGGAATSACLRNPFDVAVDAAGNLFIADRGNVRIRKVDAGTGIITTVAGTGGFSFCGDGGAATSACLANPAGVAVDAAGNLFIADQSNRRIRKVVVDTTPPVITLLGSSPLDVEVGSVYTDAGATASDNMDGDLTGSIVTANPVNTAVLGPTS